MQCKVNCPGCPLANVDEDVKSCINVAVVGAEMPASLARYCQAGTTVLQHRGYCIRLRDITKEDAHTGRMILLSKTDVVVNLVDSTSLEDSLRIATRLIDMDSRVVLVFTRYKELLATGHSLDYRHLGDLFGFPSALLETEEDFSRLLSLVVDVFDSPFNEKRHIHVHYGTDVDEAIDQLTAVISTSEQLRSKYHDRYIAVRMLENHQYILPFIENDPASQRISELASKLRTALTRELGQAPDVLIRQARHGYIHGALQETLHHSKDNSDHSVLQKIDSLLTSRWLGFPLMILILLGVFEATFALGAYPQQWIENGIELLSVWLVSVLPGGWLANLLVNGIVQGVGAVLAFLPNIIILFFFLSLLEDSGYMSRAAFLMDKIMHRIGLHGRSFVPMLLGFGCNVPAIMSARSIDDAKDRTLTMLMIPFMSCSARLPVYLLFVSAFFERQKALVMIGIYAAGIVLSILFAYVLKHTRLFRKSEDDYVSQLPPFRKPTWRNTGLHIWERVSDYMQKISTVILAASVIIWALEYFPSDKTSGGVDKESSYLAMIGKAMEPVMEPLGFDWKMNVCLLTGLPAKEAIVSTMGILYHTDDDASLAEVLCNESGMTPAVAMAFMLFVLLYFPCIATIATLKREIGWRWALFSVANSLVLAWIVAGAVSSAGILF